MPPKPTVLQQRIRHHHRIERAAKRSAAGISRRELLTGAGSAAVLLGLSPLLGGCGDGDGSSSGIPAGKESHTLFVNLSHEDHAGKSYFLTGGGQKITLTRVSDEPSVLARARRNNAFLRQVPDAHITHHVENLLLPTDSVTLLYLSSDIDTASGTWAMSAVYLSIPSQGAEHAFGQARKRAASGAMPHSAKRRMYGIAAAASADDLREERVLLDVNAHAAAIMGAHPDLFSLEPNSAFHIHANHIDNDDATATLAQALADPQYGPAVPEQPSGKTNAIGWGTLTPVVDDATGQAFRNTKGQHAGRIQYLPVFHPDIVEFTAQSVGRLASNTKDDPSLGADITGLRPEPTDPPDPALAGAMWMRQDGASFVDHSAGATQVRDGNAVMTLKQVGPQNGLDVQASLRGTGASPQVALALTNWYVRFLGVYLQFFDNSNPPKLLSLAAIPEYTSNTIIAGHSKDLDTPYEMWVSVLGSEFTILGIPTMPGFVAPVFTVPASVSTVRILASGIGSGSNNYPDTLVAGELMTGFISFGVTAILCAVGAAATFSPIMKAVVVPVASALAQELVVIFSAVLNHTSPGSGAFWLAQAIALCKFLLGFANGKKVGIYVDALADAVTVATTEAAAEDSIPVAGWIMLGVSLAAGAANLIETSTEIALSPWTYVDDLVFTHDLSVNIQRDPQNGTFPKGADHFVVTVLFDDGTPHVQTMTLPQPVPATLAPVVFKAVPLGGTVNVSVAFYQAVDDTRGVLLGKGTTGPIANTPSAVAAITLQELAFPITANTVYVHSRKTALGSNGKHVWDDTALPPTANAGNLVCGTAGTLCNFQSITVRQDAGGQPGYVGYVWQGENSDPGVAPGCQGGSAGQFDQMANLNTGTDANDGYIANACGFDQPGVKLAYSLLSQGGTNFYLDTSDPDNLYLRQVMLDPPAFSVPGSHPCGGASNEAWGVLNFMPDALLLHPAGHFVSISRTVHKIETLKIPAAAMADCDARQRLLAQPKSGKGSRPGLMTSPVAAAVAPDGTILALESGDPSAGLPARIQAFDIGGNPKPFFGRQQSPYFLELSATPNHGGWQFLDMAVEMGGFVYVLACNQPQGIYRLDLYEPTQTGSDPVSSTTGFNAARIAVDFWRNVYALNYEVIPVVGGGTPARTEPSVSLWVPKDSCIGASCG